MRTQTIVTAAKFDNDTIVKLKELTKANAPYNDKAALVVISGLYKRRVTVVMIFSNREFSMFDDRGAAIDYLAGRW